MTTTLYKLTETNLLSWSIAVDGKIVVIEHGQVNGKKQIDKHECGSIALAFEEMERRISLKKDQQGYSYEEPTNIPRLPMLASSFAAHNLASIVRIQPKLDGIRCIGTYNQMQSRRGELINSMPHIQQALSTLPPGIRLDGELYCHGESFQEHLSVIKRDTPVREHSKFKYHVFDVQLDDEIYETRLEFLKKIFQVHFPPHLPMVLVPTISIKKEDIVVAAYKHYHMYEGVILRNPMGLYRYNTRSPDLQKYKFVNTEECKIVDIVASKTGREAGAAIFVCSHNGTTFKVRPKMSLYIRKGIFENASSFIGRWTRVTFESYSDKGKPLKPRAEGIEWIKEDLQ